MSSSDRRIARRTFLQVAAAGALAACAPNASPGSATDAASTTPGDAGATATDTPTTAAATAASKAAAPASGTSTVAATTAQQPTTPEPTPAPAPSGGPAAFVRSGSPSRNQVALTFHCNGAPALATKLLDLLHERSVPVTVFAVGNWLDDNPPLAKRIVDDGHELANHTWSHQPMGPMGRATMADEIKRCADVLTRYVGSIGPWFRPSGIEVPTPAILAEAGKVGYRTSVGYDVDSLDFQDPGAAAVRRNVANGARAGSIISLHFGHANTPEAMPGILDDLAAKGLTPVTVSTLLH